jgi:hypothetical protein
MIIRRALAVAIQSAGDLQISTRRWLYRFGSISHVTDARQVDKDNPAKAPAPGTGKNIFVAVGFDGTVLSRDLLNRSLEDAQKVSS